MSNIINVGVIGHTGRLGKPLVEILKRHPYTNLIYTENRNEGPKGNIEDAELIFLALPYGESEKYMHKLNRKRLIDLSIDHRESNEWVYGLPELNRKNIENAKRIANPGCYATSIILGLAPIKERIKDICIMSTSGISGAGKEVDTKDNFKVYKEGKQHSQIKEIEKSLNLKDILFTPQRIDTAYKGIVSTIYGKINYSNNIEDFYNEFYRNSKFVRIVKDIETKNVNNTNFCDIKISYFDGRILIISALDNLIKGGSGQAIQNFNVMYGLDEEIGLV